VLKQFLNDLSWSAVASGFVVMLVGFTSSAAIIFQAATVAGASPAQISSWIGALGFGIGITCIGLSLRYRLPIVTAWATPSAALLITSLEGVSLNQTIGIFIFSGALVTLCGLTGWFEKSMKKIPLSIASAMLAGILVRFGMNVFSAMQQAFALVALMFVVYLIGRRFFPRYAIILVLVLGSVFAWSKGMFVFTADDIALTRPVWMHPEFSLSSIISVGIPLFIVSMASQNVPGVATLRSCGYTPPVSKIMTWTGLTTMVLAPFGCFSVCLAAITAAICASDESHPDPARRYISSVFSGVFYLIAGIFGATVVALIAAFPQPLIMAIAGLALFGTIANGLFVAMADTKQREPALVTFLVTASGMSLFGVGAAFWGIVIGALTLFALNWHHQKKPKTDLTRLK
jgi:benzoate membrane transport protein